MLSMYIPIKLEDRPDSSLVERPLQEREVAGLNPATPYQRRKNGTKSSLG